MTPHDEVMEELAKVIRAAAIGPVLSMDRDLDAEWEALLLCDRAPYLCMSRAAMSAIYAELRVSTVEMQVAGTEEFLCIAATEERAEACWQAMLAASPLNPEAGT